MKNFILYFLEKQLEDLAEKTILSESKTADLEDLYVKGVLKGRKKALNLLLEELKKKYLKMFYRKFPKVQYEDIEEAFHETTSKIINEKPKSEKKIETLFKKLMIQNLSEFSNKKRKVRKNLSCVKVIKSSLGYDQMSSLMRRVEKLLTPQEKSVIELCVQGKPVRTIGKELNISAATAWRSLNSAIDKIRLSHGMKSRKLG